jgi:probable rRNA maturation factor
MIRIAISDQQKRYKPSRLQLRKLARAVLLEEGIETAEISVALVDDVKIAEIHAEYLNDPTSTDVITFPFGNDDKGLTGEIVVSMETAAREAQRGGCAVEDEVQLYLIHGLLHLCGYDDVRSSDRKQMRARERHHLDRHGIRVAEVTNKSKK